MAVTRATLPDEIYKRIKDLILDGGLMPGEMVTIQGLSSAFGVSAMPVREALQRLTGERALTVVSGRSIGVPELDPGRFADMSRVRIELESMAAAWATGRLTAGDLKQLATYVKAMDRANADGDTRAYVRANHTFHFAIYSAAGSEALLSIIEGLWLRVSPYFHLLHQSGNYAESNLEHRLILDALSRNKPAEVAKHLQRDIEAAAEVLQELLATAPRQHFLVAASD